MIFRSVVTAGSINGAAALLGYTPSAVSQHIAALSKETGLTLIERVGRGVEVTPAGRILADEAESVLAELSSLGTRVDDLRAGRSGRIAFHTFSSVGTAWLPDVVATLSTEFPDTNISVRIDEVLTAVQANRPDVAIIAKTSDEVVVGYREHHLLTEPYRLVVPVGHPLAKLEEVDVAKLQHERLIDNDVSHGPCRERVMIACAAAGFVPKFIVETTDYPSAIEFVARGVGVTVVPLLGVGNLPAGAVALPLVNPTPMRVVCAQVKDAVADTHAVRRAMFLLRAAATRAGREKSQPDRVGA